MPFSTLGVLRRALQTLLAHLPAFLLMAVIVFGPVFVVALLVEPGSSSRAWQVGHGDATPPETTRLGGQFVVGMLAFLAQYLLAGALTYGTFQHLRGRRVGVLDTIRAGVRHLLPVVDVAFVTGVMVGIGFVMFVVPGVILACMFFVAVPVAVVERPGVFEALARSGRLTRGHRVPILGVLVATLGLMMAAGVLIPIAFAPLGHALAILIGTVGQLFFGVYAGVCQTIAYHDLRRLDEPDTSAEFLDVFDAPSGG